MTHYDPEIPPDPATWLALDEQLRISLVERHHRDMRVKLPNVKLHASLQAVVENQIAEGLDPVVRAIARLMKQGLSRHDALHAVASVVAEQIFEATHTQDAALAEAVPARYFAAVERLTAQEWKRRYG